MLLPPSIVMRSVLFATGLDAETRRSAVGETIVRYTAPLSGFPTVARAHASLSSIRPLCAVAALEVRRQAANTTAFDSIGVNTGFWSRQPGTVSPASLAPSGRAQGGARVRM